MERAELERELEQLHPACWGWALACCERERDVAQDILQSAYLKVLAGQVRFDGRSGMRTWLFGVIRLTAAEERRRQRTRYVRESPDESAAAAIADPASGADVAAERSEERAALVAALGTLSERQREVVELVFYHGMTIDEAARVMDVSPGTAHVHYDRGKKALAAALSQRFAPARVRPEKDR